MNGKAVMLLLLAACSPGAGDARPAATSSGRAATPSSDKLPAGIVGRIGAMDIRREDVASVAATQGVDVSRALALEVTDALLAQGALERGYADTPVVRAAVRAHLARARLEDLYAVVGERSPTDDEIADVTARHFLDLDRPEAFRVIHAVVRVPEGGDASIKARARGVADRIARAVLPASNANDFRDRAKSVDPSGLEVVVEELKPVAADGRIVNRDHAASVKPDLGRYATSFARAASRLAAPGQKSGVVETEFGFHVLMLLERSEGHATPLEERRVLLHDEVIGARTKQHLDELIRALRNAHPPVVDRSAETVLRSLDAPSP